jgi:sulfur-oxidizing protein SoxZ
MSRIGSARAKLPEKAKRGEIIEIRANVLHPMESGFRLDNTGKPIARHIVESFTCSWNGREIFSARIRPGVSTNPYFAFFAVAEETGDVVFTWKDDQGGVATQTAYIEVQG